MTEHQQSPSNLIVERHYVPRSAPRPTARNRSNISQPREQSQGTNQELVSPGLSSLNSNTPNGYTADNSISEISSLAESVSSMPHLLDPSKLPYHQRFMPESDSGMYSGRARYTGSTTSYGDTDRESIAGESDSRYRGELFQPQAPPRIVQRQVRQMYGEVHPKNLASDDLPTPSSGDELETMSEASIPSFTDAPRVRPRASLRRKKLAEINGGFVSEDDSSIASPIDRSKSMPRSILKSQNTDISDAESLATSGNFRRTASGRTVRFEHNDKSRSIPKKVIDYEKLDSADSGSSRKKKGSTSDPFSIVKPVGIKPARNDKRRSSGRSSQRGSQRGSQGRQSRSSSFDRSRSPARRSSSNTSDKVRPRSSSRTRQSPTAQKKPEPSVAVKGEDVKIQMPDRRSDGVTKDLTKMADKADKQKILKWCLIVGVPVVLIVIITIVVAVSIRG